MQKTGPRDVLLQLFSIFALYASIVSFLTLVFNYIDIYFPYVLDDGVYARANALSNIRWSLSMLIVVFPGYLAVARFLRKEYESIPERRELRTRKWLIYITLFVATIAIGGDLIALIFKFLNGELTTRFLLKILAVFFAAGSVFFYYFTETRSHGRRMALARPTRYLSLVATIIVVTAIIAGFFTAGSPSKRRLERADEKRVQNLEYIQWQVQDYWRAKGMLPPSLDALSDDLRGVVIPKDPDEKKKGYEYYIRGALEFSLCATFNYESSRSPVEGYNRAPEFVAEGVWAHGAGRICFERTIDPDFLKMEKPLPASY